MTTPEFFEYVADGASQLDMLNYLERVTDKFENRHKINLLLEDLYADIAGEQERKDIKDANIRASRLFNLQVLVEALKLKLTEHVQPEVGRNTKPIPKIFKNESAFRFFETLRQGILKEESKYSDYSFIMRAMIGNKLLVETNHKQLIAFINDEYNAGLEKKQQFITVTSKEKIECYEQSKELFKGKIEFIWTY